MKKTYFCNTKILKNAKNMPKKKNFGYLYVKM